MFLNRNIRNLLIKELEAINDRQDFPVNRSDAVTLIHLAWREVTRESSVNYSEDAGWKKKSDSDEYLQMHTEDYEDTKIQSTIEVEMRY